MSADGQRARCTMLLVVGGRARACPLVQCKVKASYDVSSVSVPPLSALRGKEAVGQRLVTESFTCWYALPSPPCAAFGHTHSTVVIQPPCLPRTRTSTSSSHQD